MAKDWDWRNLPDDVETAAQICARAKEFIDEIHKKHKDKTVAVVCHAGTKMALLTVINNTPLSDFERWAGSKNTAVTEVEFREDKNHKIHVHNCTEHLS